MTGKLEGLSTRKSFKGNLKSFEGETIQTVLQHSQGRCNQTNWRKKSTFIFICICICICIEEHLYLYLQSVFGDWFQPKILVKSKSIFKFHQFCCVCFFAANFFFVSLFHFCLFVASVYSLCFMFVPFISQLFVIVCCTCLLDFLPVCLLQWLLSVVTLWCWLSEDAKISCFSLHYEQPGTTDKEQFMP